MCVGVILEGSESRSHLASVKQPHGEEQVLTFAQRSPGYRLHRQILAPLLTRAGPESSCVNWRQ